MSLNSKTKTIAVVMTVAVVMFTAVPAGALKLKATEHQITTSQLHETTPMLGNDGFTDIVVYTQSELLGSSFGPGDIFYQRLADGVSIGNPIRITNDPADPCDDIIDDQLNDISGDYIVYTAFDDTTSSSGAIMLYQISTGTSRSLWEADIIQEPRIDGDVVAWREGDASSTHIMFYNLNWPPSLDPQLLPGQIPPAIDLQIGDRFIVWAEFHDSQLDIAAFDHTEMSPQALRPSTTSVYERWPATSGDWMAWQAFEIGASVSRIELFNVNTNELRVIADGGVVNQHPAIHDDLVVYESNLPGNFDVYVYHIITGETFQVTADPCDQYLNDIFGNSAAYVDQRNGNEDIFISTLEFLPRTVYVDADATGANDGTSWADAYNYLQDALENAEYRDHILVAQGTYTPDSNSAVPVGSGDRTATFELKNDLELYGGYAGFGESDPNMRDVTLYETVLSGDLNGDDADVSDPWDLLGEPSRAENSYHVVTCSINDASVILDGFVITAGNAKNLPSPQGSGGGIRISSGRPTINNCTFSKNSVMEFGAGMGNINSSPTVTNCTFISNAAGGGAMGNYIDSRPTIANCTFSGNCGTAGGAMFNYNYSRPTVTDCTFSGNSAENGGGIYNDDHCDPTLTNCAFISNSADAYGGGMHNYSFCNPTATNCTFKDNSAGASGGGIFNYNSEPTITNGILWNNSDSGGTDESAQIHGNGTPAVNYCCVQGWTGGLGGTGNTGADPMFRDAAGRLGTYSSCIDAADNTAVPAGIEIDLDANPRFGDSVVIGDTGNGTPPIVDMGAYEFYQYVLYVDADATGANNGTSWPDAFIHLRDALGSAQYGNEIRVAEGIYKPDESSYLPITSGDRFATFELRNGVAVYGGYAGFGKSNPNARNFAAYKTILSGDINVPDVNADNSYNVICSSGADANTVLDGFTITGGNADWPGEEWEWSSGAGMRNSNGAPTVTNCIFTENYAGSGAGMWNSSSDPTVTNCTFSLNSAISGGGMENGYSDPTVTNCTFSKNDAGHGSGMANHTSSPTVTNCTFSDNGTASSAWGGGMFNWYYSNPTITNCTFNGNSAEQGGGMYHYRSNPTVTDCTFSSNSAEQGGGIYCYESEPKPTNCTFNGNRADDGGGGMYNEHDSSPTVTNCTFRLNSADNDGGGMYNKYDSSPTVTNCTFRLNTASVNNGGGMCNYVGSDSKVTNCTFSSNSANNYGGGVATEGSASIVINCTFADNSAGNCGGGISHFQTETYPMLANCILWGNTAPTGAQIYNAGSYPGIGYCDIQGGWEGDDNIDADPCFFDAVNPDPNLRDYHLRPGSPCINTAYNDFVPADTTDLDGDGNTTEPVPFDIDRDLRVSDTTVDMGSDEVIWDGVKDIRPENPPVILNPGGGLNEPKLEAVVVVDLSESGNGGNIKNNSSVSGDVTVVEMNTNPHPPTGGFEALGKTLRIDTTLADGEFFMTISIPFDANGLGSLDPCDVYLMYYDQTWLMAVGANTQPLPPDNHHKNIDTSPPSLDDMNDFGLGHHGVYWDSSANKGFVWANVDHSTDFSAAAHGPADFEPDGDVDLADFAAFAQLWLQSDCLACSGADLTGDGNVNLNDLMVFANDWLQ